MLLTLVPYHDASDLFASVTGGIGGSYSVKVSSFLPSRPWAAEDSVDSTHTHTMHANHTPHLRHVHVPMQASTQHSAHQAGNEREDEWQRAGGGGGGREEEVQMLHDKMIRAENLLMAARQERRVLEQENLRRTNFF